MLGDKEGFLLKIISSEKEFYNLSDFWQRIECDTVYDTSVAQSYAWCKEWWDAYVKNGGTRNSKPYIVLVYERNKPLLIWPLMIVNSWFFKKLVPISYPLNQYSDVITSLSGDVEKFIAKSFAYIINESGVDILYLNNVRHDTILFRFLEQRAHIIRTRCSPLLDLRQYKDYAKYLETRSKSTRKALKYRRRKLEKIDNLKIVVSYENDDCKKYVPDLISMKTRWLKTHTNSSTSEFADNRYNAFLSGLCGNNYKNLKTMSLSIFLGDKLISTNLNMILDQRMFLYVISYDIDYNKYGIGNIVAEETLKHAFSKGYSYCDFFPYSDPYKLAWANNNSVPISNMAFTFNFKGMIIYMYYRLFFIAKTFLYDPLSSNIRVKIKRILRKS